MKMRSLIMSCCLLLSSAMVLAQAVGEVADLISGSWGTDGTTFLELKHDGKGAVSGTAIWRGQGQETRAAIKVGTFDPKTSALRLEGEAKRPDGEVARFVIEGKVDKDTLSGTYTFGSDKGVFTFTKQAVGNDRATLHAQTAKRTPEQIRASYEAHKGDFDYLLGDWAFTAVSREYGKMRGYWSAVRLDEGQILDEYRVVGDNGETYYVTTSLRNYNSVLDRWELVGADAGTGLQDMGTGRRVGAEMHIEQRFGVMSERPSIWRIRYYDIRADRFSWTADRSVDEGKTWDTKHQEIEARRIGPSRSMGPLTRVQDRKAAADPAKKK